VCGIAGLFGIGAFGAQDDVQPLLTGMASAIAHRGPDGAGIWYDSEAGIGLAHRRLAIVDLTEAGAQPMSSATGRYVIAFNGEIYNHSELRRALEELGAAPRWRGHSDTETLLAAIGCWGLDEALRRAHGMFALALWDKRERRLSLARDRMGEKPLYWGWAGSALVFGSELKALRQHPEFPSSICHEALALYLRFSYVPAPRSIHPGIYKLEPGCILDVAGTPPAGRPDHPLRPGNDLGSISIRRYWSLDLTLETGQQSPYSSEAAALEALESALEAAVSRQMLADVPLGAFLSGGIDSSLIVALMQQQSDRPVRTFTIGFDDPSFNEAPHAAAVARHLGTDHTEVIVTDADARGVIPDLPHIYDEPFADSSQIPTFLVSRVARSGVTVALSGDGGDELFGGYNRYLWAPRLWQRLGWVPRPGRQLLAASMAAIPVPAWDRIAGGSGVLGVARLGDKVHKLAARLGRPTSVDDLYRSLVSEWDERALPLQGRGTSVTSLLDDPLPAGLEGDAAGRMMAQDMRTYLPDDILCKVDRAAMAVSLETRVPFLDPEVMAVSVRLPADLKLRNGQGKWALRQLLDRHVPRELIDRPKAGFGIPVGEWLRGPLKDWAEPLLSQQRLADTGVLDPQPIRRAWLEHQSGRRDWTGRLWNILMLEAWREKWQ